jgi:hypothetical protein
MELFSLGLVNQAAVACRLAPSHTPEHEWQAGLLDQCLRPEPTETPWQYACREVFLGGKQSATPRQYDIELAPYTKEWQELPMRPEVRVGGVMKSSRSGFTEASFNIIRWMPENRPGNALYAISSDKLAREVADRRILPTMPQAFLSLDKNDTTLSRISMPTMDVLCTGSASSGPFMEIWYRLIILDELENHIQKDNTTTYQRALSRQADVPDGLTLAISKPELAGGIIHTIYVSGSQKRYLVPCPRCERLIRLTTDHLVADGCLVNDEWDLEQVLKRTVYQCQLCQQPILEHEKKAMLNSDLAKWVPTPTAERLRAPDTGKFVPPEPGVETYQISDLYSLHERLTWGELKKMHLLAHVINPSEEAKKYFRINHEGEAYEGTIYSLTEESILALKAGRNESTVTKHPDGTESTIVQLVAPSVLINNHRGERRQDAKFYLSYLDGERQAPLPFQPVQLTVTVDKQETFLQYVVFAWLWDAQAFMVDIGKVQDEDELGKLRSRAYHIEGADPMFIHGGLIDSGHRPHEVYRACLRFFRESAWQLWPARGEGRTEEYKGKLFRYKDDWVDGQKIVVRQFYDHGIKDEFYLSHVQKRAEPRLWLPEDLPAYAVTQLLAERYNESEKEWQHNKTKVGPNDIGDCCKLQYVIRQENCEEWRKHRPAR